MTTGFRDAPRLGPSGGNNWDIAGRGVFCCLPPRDFHSFPRQTGSWFMVQIFSGLKYRALRAGRRPRALDTLQAVFQAMIKQAKSYGLAINLSKSELHAWGKAPHATICFRHQQRNFTLSTGATEGSLCQCPDGPTGRHSGTVRRADWPEIEVRLDR